MARAERELEAARSIYRDGCELLQDIQRDLALVLSADKPEQVRETRPDSEATSPDQDHCSSN